MKKEYLKDIVAQIRKLADDVPPPPPGLGSDGIPSPPGLGTVPVGGSGYVATGPIKDMQQAMQEFARLVTSYAASQSQPGQKPDSQPVNSRKKHFNDFITEQYLANSDLKGEEYTPDEKVVSRDSKQPTDLIEMNIVVNGLKRIGSPQSELNADNMWDFRTNNALKNVYAFAYGLVNLAKDFGRTNVKSFTPEDLAKMKELIPEDRDPTKMPLKDKIDRATILSGLIKKLTNFYKYYIETIAMHPAFTRYIAGNEPMMTIQKGGDDPTALDQNDQKYVGNLDALALGNRMIPNVNYKYPIAIPGPGQTTGSVDSVPMSSLQDLNHFRAFLVSLGYPQNTTNDPRIIKMALDAIMKHIDGVLSSSSAQASVKPQYVGPDVGTKPIA